jgi:hypothetical protein
VPESQPPLAGRVESLVNRRGGTSPSRQWFLRQPDGSGQGVEGWHLPTELKQRRLPPEAFPPFLLREDWTDPGHGDWVGQYQARMAPRLLALPGLAPESRRRLEALAWENPELVSQLYRQYPLVLDRDGLKVALIKARMIRSNARGRSP